MVVLLLSSVNQGVNKPVDRVLHLWASLLMFFWESEIPAIIQYKRHSPPMPLFKALIIAAMTKKYGVVASSKMGSVPPEWIHDLQPEHADLFGEITDLMQQTGEPSTSEDAISWNIPDQQYVMCYPVLQKMLRMLGSGCTLQPELGIRFSLERSPIFRKKRFFELVCVAPAHPQLSPAATTIAAESATAVPISTVSTQAREDEGALNVSPARPIRHGSRGVSSMHETVDVATTPPGGAVVCRRRSQRSPSANADSEPVGTASRQEYARDQIAQACSTLLRLLDHHIDVEEFRWGEHAWLLASCASRLPVPYGDDVKASAIRCLQLWEMKRMSSSESDIDSFYCDDLWAFKAAQTVNFHHGVETSAQPDLHRHWRSCIPDLSLGTEWNDRWKEWLEGGLAVWSAIGAPNNQDEDSEAWLYLQRWQISLAEAVAAIKSRLSSSLALDVGQHLAYNITHVIFVASNYGMLQVNPDESLYLSRGFIGAMDLVSAVFADDIVMANDAEDRVEPLMELLFSYSLLGCQAPDSVRSVMNQITRSGEPIPGMFEGSESETIWKQMHRCYCTLLGMAAWSQLLLAAEMAPIRFLRENHRSRGANSNFKNCIRAERSKQRRNLPTVQRRSGSSTGQRPQTMYSGSPLSFMPPRSITRFAWNEYDSIPLDNLVENGIVFLPGLLSDFMSPVSVYSRLCELAGQVSGGITVGLWNGVNVEESGGDYDPSVFSDAFLQLSDTIKSDIMPALQAQCCRAKLITSLEGDINRTIYFRVKSAGHFTPKHSDMGFFVENLSHLTGKVFRCYTVWILLSNSTDRAPLRFQDGSGRWHNGPETAGDAVVFNSCIQHESLPPNKGGRVSVDFRILVKDSRY